MAVEERVKEEKKQKERTKFSANFDEFHVFHLRRDKIPILFLILFTPVEDDDGEEGVQRGVRERHENQPMRFHDG